MLFLAHLLQGRIQQVPGIQQLEVIRVCESFIEDGPFQNCHKLIGRTVGSKLAGKILEVYISVPAQPTTLVGEDPHQLRFLFIQDEGIRNQAFRSMDGRRCCQLFPEECRWLDFVVAVRSVLKG